MAKKIQVRKIIPEDVKTIALLHEKTVPGLSAKLGKDYLIRFYRIIIGHPEIHTCLAAFADNKIVGMITVTQDAKKTYQLLHSLLSLQIVLRILIEIIRGKISLREIINRLRFERFIEKRLTPPYVSILTIFVKKEYQKQEIGRLLLKIVINRYLKSGKTRLYVDAHADNLVAIKFYKSAGFITKDIAFDAVIMEHKMKSEVRNGKVAIVIPTYNERKTIKKLIEKIVGLSFAKKIILVDDNSPDGTGDLLDKIAQKIADLLVIHRKAKQGRGSAVITGFTQALKDKEIKFIIEMDADFLHQPEEIPRLLENGQKYDIVIASRYLPQSKILGLSLQRRIFSRLANFWARLILGIPITDYTNGFRCYKRNILEKLDFDKIKTRGFVTLSEIAYKLFKNGASFGEIPAIFTNTKGGTTNFSLKEVKEAFFSVLALRFNL